MHRREFLHPRRLAKIAGPVLDIAEVLDSPPAEPAPVDDPVLLRFARRAMATTFEVILPFDAPRGSGLAQAALDEIDRLETQLTVYRDTSEVSRLNATAARQPMRVEANLFQLLACAARIHQETEGAFDISVGALIKAWGFYRRAGLVPSLQERQAVCQRIGMQHVRLDPERQTVHFERQGLELNLGSIGKGYALDRALALIRKEAPNVLLHGGHSSVIASGNERPDRAGWSVGLTDPEYPDRRLGLVHVRNRALATSALSHQHFEHQGKKLGHLLDPRTAWPAEGMLSATVTAPSAAEADALATAFFILGVEKARAFCDAHPEIGAVFIPAVDRRVVLLGRATEEVELFR